MEDRTRRSIKGEAVFIDIGELGDGSVAVVFREVFDSPRLLVTGCDGSATALKLKEYASDNDGFPEGSVGRVTIKKNGDNDVLQIRGIEEGAVRVDYSDQHPKLRIGEEKEVCVYRGEHSHND